MKRYIKSESVRIPKITGIQPLLNKTKNIIPRDRSTWVDLYYNVEEHKVYTTPGEGRYKLTTYLNPNVTKEDVIYDVNYFMSM